MNNLEKKISKAAEKLLAGKKEEMKKKLAKVLKQPHYCPYLDRDMGMEEMLGEENFNRCLLCSLRNILAIETGNQILLTQIAKASLNNIRRQTEGMKGYG